MNSKVNLAGKWDFCLDGEMRGIDEHFENVSFDDEIVLPSSTSFSKKGEVNKARETGQLTEVYKFEGYSWYRKKVFLPAKSWAQIEDCHFFLTLERTRISTVWVDGKKVGSKNSFIARHIYDLTGFVENTEPEITIMVSNTGYVTGGGHMTSPDTQTNWNGLLGEISLEICDCVHIERTEVRGDFKKNSALIKAQAIGFENAEISVKITTDLCILKPEYLAPDADLTDWEKRASSQQADATDMDILEKWLDIKQDVIPEQFFVHKLHDGKNEFDMKIKFPAGAKFWDEEEPYLYRFRLEILDVKRKKLAEKYLWFGLREFKAQGDHFEINGRRTFLRGRHQGMLFPLSGFAPMNVTGWLKDLKIAKDYGLNHERFHTCTPPEAAFIAADLLGIYLQPEIPFWGTWLSKDDEKYGEVKAAQEFLTEEGFNILKEFAGHPSFVMMSMGNELWGSPEALNELVGGYKAVYPDICFTQGSNNFQWVPNIQPHDDFFSGVRFTKERQIRGSYAMCDAPLGPIQKWKPSTNWNYDRAIKPPYSEAALKAASAWNPGKGTVEIQYGTGVKTVNLSESPGELVPHIPVVSHEIGQYFIYPDFREIADYSGVCQARNLEVFQERLEEMSISARSEGYFRSSGLLAMQCYKNELEAAIRSSLMAGFQMLDLQDFSGQGTALVGPLNALMKSKGLITAKEWREFCSSAVVMGRFYSYVLTCGEKFDFTVNLAFYRKKLPGKPKLCISIVNSDTGKAVFADELDIVSAFKAKAEEHEGDFCGLYDLGSFSADIPGDTGIVKYTLCLEVKDGKKTVCENHYDLWAYEKFENIKPTTDVYVVEEEDGSEISFEVTQSGKVAVTDDMIETDAAVSEGKSVLFYLTPSENRSLPGAYCTDFWNYPMFKSISESMGKPIPVGTLGMLIANDHPALAGFKCETYSTPQWYEIVERSRVSLLNWLGFRPIVTVIDNCEANDNLGIIYEFMIMDGPNGPSHVVICTSPLRKLIQEGNAPAAALEKSLLSYLEKGPADGILRTHMQQLRRLAY